MILLRFSLKAERVTADSDGKLTYSGSGDGTATELRTTMKFKALKMGDTTITVNSSKAYLYSDETLTLDQDLPQLRLNRQMMVQQRLRQMEVNQLSQLLILR